MLGFYLHGGRLPYNFDIFRSCDRLDSSEDLNDPYIPFMEKGDILRHEFMGKVVEVGRDNKKLKVGDRVVVPFTICCGECSQCLKATGPSASAATARPTMPLRPMANQRQACSATPI
jgi:Zn-dependent alcohol dehydrogenase